MDEFEKLLALTRAAEDCAGLARQFIDTYSEVPEFSTDPWCASSQIKQHREQAFFEARSIQDSIRAWNLAASASEYISASVGLSRLPFLFNKQSFHTAHEAARGLAECVVERWRNATGFADIDWIKDLARKLDDITTTPALDGFLLGEHYAASVSVSVGNTHDESEWMTVSEAARASGATKQEISRAAGYNELTHNGERGRGRRISKAGLVDWLLSRAGNEI